MDSKCYNLKRAHVKGASVNALNEDSDTSDIDGGTL